MTIYLNYVYFIKIKKILDRQNTTEKNPKTNETLPNVHLVTLLTIFKNIAKIKARTSLHHIHLNSVPQIKTQLFIKTTKNTT